MWSISRVILRRVNRCMSLAPPSYVLRTPMCITLHERVLTQSTSRGLMTTTTTQSPTKWSTSIDAQLAPSVDLAKDLFLDAKYKLTPCKNEVCLGGPTCRNLHYGSVPFRDNVIPDLFDEGKYVEAIGTWLEIPKSDRAKCGSLTKTRVLQSCIKLQHHALVVEMYNRPGLKRDHLRLVVGALVACNDIVGAAQVYESHLMGDVQAASQLLRGLLLWRHLSLGQQLFDSVERDHIMADIMMDGYIQSAGTAPSQLSAAEHFHASQPFHADPGLSVKLMRAYVSRGETLKGMKLLESLRNPPSSVANLLIGALSAQNKVSAALELIAALQNPTKHTYIALMKGIIQTPNGASLGRDLLERMNDIHGKEGAAELLGSTPFNIVLHALADQDAQTAATSFFRDLIPAARDVVTYNSMIKMAVNARNMELAIAYFHSLRNHPLKPDTVTFNTLLGGYVATGDLTRCKKLFKLCPDPDELTYTLLMRAYFDAGNKEKAHKLHKLKLKKVNKKTDYAVAHECRRCGRPGHRGGEAACVATTFKGGGLPRVQCQSMSCDWWLPSNELCPGPGKDCIKKTKK